MKNIKYVFYSFKEVYNNGKAFFYIYIIKLLLHTTKIYIFASLNKKLFNEISKALYIQKIDKQLLFLAMFIIFVDMFLVFVHLILDYFSELSATKYNNHFTVLNSHKCSRLKFELHDNPREKDEVKQFISDSKSVIQIFCQSINLIFAIISFFISLYISISFNIFVAIIALLVSMPAFFVRKANNRVAYELEKELNLTNRKIDYFKNIHVSRQFFKEIHLYNAIPTFSNSLKSELNNRLNKRKYIQRSKLRKELFLTFIYTIVNILINLYIIMFVVIKKLTIGDYSYFSSIINNLKNNSDSIVTTISDLLISAQKTKNYFTFLNDKTNEYEYGSQSMPQTINSITFSNVSFKYPNTDNYVINDVSFELVRNEKIAIVGINGAGKSTIINLLLRFYTPTKGQILINGYDIRIFKLYDYWSEFSCMFQDSILYNISLKENILLGNEKINKVNESALISFLSNIKIPVSYDSLNKQISKQFDENGLIFSPGQMQKINIARTLLKKNQITIFDEPSSSMDVKAEDEILDKMFSLSKNNFFIFISHKMRNLKKVDKIIFLENGSVKEIGSHEELIKNKLSYYELYKKQLFKYF